MSDSSDGRRDAQPREVTIQQLVSEYYPLLYRYAFRLTGNQYEAEDLTQQTYLTAQRKLHQLREAGAAKAWLCQILRTAFFKSLRRQRPSLAVDVDLEMGGVVGDGPNDRGPWDPERLQLALNELPERLRGVLLMFYFEDYTYEQIATELKLPLGTVMSRLSRAKAHLRKRLHPVSASKG